MRERTRERTGDRRSAPAGRVQHDLHEGGGDLRPRPEDASGPASARSGSGTGSASRSPRPRSPSCPGRATIRSATSFWMVQVMVSGGRSRARRFVSIGRGDVVGEIGDEFEAAARRRQLSGDRLQHGRVEAVLVLQGVGLEHGHVVHAEEFSPASWNSRGSSLDRDDGRRPPGQQGGQRPGPGADLQDHVVAAPRRPSPAAPAGGSCRSRSLAEPGLRADARLAESPQEEGERLLGRGDRGGSFVLFLLGHGVNPTSNPATRPIAARTWPECRFPGSPCRRPSAGRAL